MFLRVIVSPTSHLKIACSYAHMYALMDHFMGTAATWVPSGGGASRYGVYLPPSESCFICRVDTCYIPRPRHALVSTHNAKEIDWLDLVQ